MPGRGSDPGFSPVARGRWAARDDVHFVITGEEAAVWGEPTLRHAVLLLDVGDVPLHFAKCSRYLALDGTGRVEVNPKYQTMADLWFVVFALVFFATRVVMYPYVWWSASFESAAVWGGREEPNQYGYRGGCSF